MMGYELQGSALRMAKVCYVYPAGNHVDLVMLDSGESCQHVQVLSPYAGTDFGFTSGCVEPEKEGWEENLTTDPEKRDIIAVVAYLMNHPLCIGFLYPQINQMAFDKEVGRNRMIERSPSDNYRTIDQHANLEQYHPGDAWFRVGEDIEHEDLTGRDFDKQWALKRNTDKVPIMTMWNRDADEKKPTWGRFHVEKKKIILEVGEIEKGEEGEEDKIALTTVTLIGNQAHIKTTGDILAEADNNITAIAGNDISAEAGNDISAEAGNDISADAGGDISADADGDISADAGGNIAMDAGGNIDATAGGNATVTAASIQATGQASIDANAPTISATGATVNVTAPNINLTGITNIIGDINI